MDNHIVISIFLRGGMDGLSFLSPHQDSDYIAARPDIAIPTNKVLPLDATFGLHPAAEALMSIWDDGELALIPASGSTDTSRSHFAAQAIMEAGLGSDTHLTNGWLARLAATVSASIRDLGAIGIGHLLPFSLSGFPSAIGISDLEKFRLGTVGGKPASASVLGSIRSAYPSPPADLVTSQGVTAFSVMDELSAAGLSGKATPEVFGRSDIATDLWQAAQIIEADLGTRVIAMNWGGWDHHHLLGAFDTGRMYSQTLALATAIEAFWAYLSDLRANLTVVIINEFGRRVAQNANAGTDHGHGGLTMVLGGGVNGGVKGDWLGLSSDVLDRGDVPVLTDYRHILAEIIDRRMGVDAVTDVFPSFPTSPSDYLGLTTA